MLIDSHCHLEPKDFLAADGGSGDLVDERPAVLARARAAGLGAFVCIGSGKGLDEVENAVAMAEAHPDIWAAIGIHPHDAARIPDGTLDEIARLATRHPRVVAVGETGLDYYYEHSPKEAQRRALVSFIALAKQAKKPLSLHIRDAHADAIEILRAERASDVGGAVHCFTGALADAKAYVELGFHISFSGVVTFKSAGAIREAARWVPLERVLVETDCPYLAPVPMRGKRNEPAFLVHTAAALAAERGMAPEELARATSDNCRALFRLA